MNQHLQLLGNHKLKHLTIFHSNRITSHKQWKLHFIFLIDNFNFVMLSFFQGGMKAVIWTDVFQSSVMLAGLIAMIVQVSYTHDKGC